MTAATIASVAFWRLRKRVVRDLLIQGLILLTQTLQARRTSASQPAGSVLTRLERYIDKFSASRDDSRCVKMVPVQD